MFLFGITTRLLRRRGSVAEAGRDRWMTPVCFADLKSTRRPVRRAQCQGHMATWKHPLSLLQIARR
jgi:hypothetical protein